MASTAGKLDVYNMALGFIGTRTVGSPNERTPEAIQCELYWDRARRGALRDYPYSFARKRVRLARKSMPDVYAGEWNFCYGLPDKCLSVRCVHGGHEGPGRDAFRLQASGAEVVILCNVEQAMADITVDVEDLSLWDELFVMAMARKLACLIAVPLLKNNPQKVQELEQLYSMALPRAHGKDAAEEEREKRPDSWLVARGAW